MLPVLRCSLFSHVLCSTKDKSCGANHRSETGASSVDIVSRRLDASLTLLTAIDGARFPQCFDRCHLEKEKNGGPIFWQLKLFLEDVNMISRFFTCCGARFYIFVVLLFVLYFDFFYVCAEISYKRTISEICFYFFFLFICSFNVIRLFSSDNFCPENCFLFKIKIDVILMIYWLCNCNLIKMLEIRAEE